jgi:heme-degrading monooxygenase HmoA
MVITLVRFKSGLTDEEVQAKFEARANAYERVPGLIEKLYVRYRETGEFGAVYVWDDEDALEAFRQSDLGRSIPDAYRIDGELETTLLDVTLVVQSALT